MVSLHKWQWRMWLSIEPPWDVSAWLQVSDVLNSLLFALMVPFEFSQFTVKFYKRHNWNWNKSTGLCTTTKHVTYITWMCSTTPETVSECTLNGRVVSPSSSRVDGSCPSFNVRSGSISPCKHLYNFIQDSLLNVSMEWTLPCDQDTNHKTVITSPVTDWYSISPCGDKATEFTVSL